MGEEFERETRLLQVLNNINFLQMKLNLTGTEKKYTDISTPILPSRASFNEHSNLEN
jgi:hypothetical protein